MFDNMNAPPPAGKARRHGSKRRQMRRLKVQARREERRLLNKLINED